jgi:hypothetical protein
MYDILYYINFFINFSPGCIFFQLPGVRIHVRRRRYAQAEELIFAATNNYNTAYILYMQRCKLSMLAVSQYGVTEFSHKLHESGACCPGPAASCNPPVSYTSTIVYNVHCIDTWMMQRSWELVIASIQYNLYCVKPCVKIDIIHDVYHIQCI